MAPPLPLPALALSLPSLPAVLPEGPAGAAAFLAAWALASGGVVLLFERVLLARARASRNQLDDVVAHALQLPLYAALVLAGVWIAARWSGALPPSWAAALSIALPILLALVAAFGLVRVAHGVMDQHARRRPSFRAVQGILEFGVRLGVYAIALMLVLDHLGVSITPILGALGIAGLAVALALQDTLANFFAGLYISLDRPLREGDFVELDGGSLGTIRGYVQDVGWRSLRVRELSNNVFVVPNSRVASGVVKNYDLPEAEMAVLVDLSVGYGSDLAHVERVTVDTARDVLHTVAGGVAAFEPFVRFHTFADSGIGFTVILRGKTFVDQYLLKHEFIKALHACYRREGVEIPFPQRTVHLAREPGEGAAAQAALGGA